MKPLRQLLLLLLCAAVVTCDVGDASSSRSSVIAITNVTVIDGTGTAAQPGMTVVVEGDRITAVGRAAEVAAPPGARVVDGGGRFLIPGLWDSHVHLGNAGESALPQLVAHGVTSVRDLGSSLADVRQWQHAARSGMLTMPRVRAAGGILESERWLQAVQSLPVTTDFPLWQLSPRIAVSTVEQARAAVDSLVDAGADIIKVRTVASPDVFRAIVARARERGRPVAAHAPTSMPFADAVQAGPRSIEHTEPTVFALSGAASAARLLAFNDLVRAGTYVVPTIIAETNWRLVPDSVVLAVLADTAGRNEPRRRLITDQLAAFWRFQMSLKQYESPQQWQALHDRGIEDLRTMHDVGVRMIAGTDLGAVLVFPGSSLHDELVLMVERIGMSPMDALQSATQNAAEFFGAADSIGTVEAGKLADLVLLEADPLEDIRNTRRVAGVVLNGAWFDRAALDALLRPR